MIVVLLAHSARAGQADIYSVTIEPSPQQRSDLLPYRTALLAVGHSAAPSGGDVVQAAAIRDALGGPTFLYPLTVPPGSRGSLEVALPALAPSQTYVVKLLSQPSPGAAKLGESRVTVNWPLELVNYQEFVNARLYDRYAQELPAWPGRVLRNALLVAALFCLGAAGAFLIRRPALRLVVLAAIVTAATVAAWLAVAGADVVVVKRFDLPASMAPGELLVIGARRDASWQSDHGLLAPVYFSRYQMQSDSSLVIRPPNGGAQATVGVQEVLMLRRLARPTRQDG